jgi:hypothetical protein
VSGCKLLLVTVSLALTTRAMADEPLAVPQATTCSFSGSVCATRDAATVIVWRKLANGHRKTLWRAPGAGANLQVADDGLSLVEIQPWANLVERSAGPPTIILTFFRPDGPPVRVRLGEMIRNVAALPLTVSHRRWARTLGYDGRGHFQVDTVEGRRILFDPQTGRAIVIKGLPLTR